jgi:hypothetical protein
MSYDFRMAKQRNWDPSVLGITPDDYARMDEEERERYMVDALNRAADLLDSTVAAFAEQFQLAEINALTSMANKIVAIARTR